MVQVSTAAEDVTYTTGLGLVLAQSTATEDLYLYHDGQGSTRALADASGNIVDSYTYTAFGELYGYTGTPQTDFLYTGQQFDDLTSLYNLRARQYDPALGRFLGQDTYPINYQNPVELNRYIYVANNPINAVDPSGLMAMVDYPLVNNQVAGRNVKTAGALGAATRAFYMKLVLLYLPLGILTAEILAPDTYTEEDLVEFRDRLMKLMEELRRAKDTEPKNDPQEKRDSDPQPTVYPPIVLTPVPTVTLTPTPTYQYIYRLDPCKTAKCVSLHKIDDYETGLSFTEHRTSPTDTEFRVDKLEAAGFVVRYDGGQLVTMLFTGEPWEGYGVQAWFPKDHVTVYWPNEEQWREWYEQDTAYRGQAQYANLAIVLWNLREIHE